MMEAFVKCSMPERPTKLVAVVIADVIAKYSLYTNTKGQMSISHIISVDIY